MNRSRCLADPGRLARGKLGYVRSYLRVVLSALSQVICQVELRMCGEAVQRQRSSLGPTDFLPPVDERFHPSGHH